MDIQLIAIKVGEIFLVSMFVLVMAAALFANIRTNWKAMSTLISVLSIVVWVVS